MASRTRNTVLTLLLTIISFAFANAASFSGKIISNKGGQPVPYANILVKTSTIGIATDDNGKFTIDIPDEYLNSSLVISALGFDKKEYQISKLRKNLINIVVINNKEYTIDEVKVNADSRVLYGAIKQCIQRIPTNHITDIYSYEFNYSLNGKTAKGVFTDSTGYIRSSGADAYRQVGYHFYELNNGTVNYPFFAGRTNMEDLLTYDWARAIGNVLDEENLYEYKLKVAEKEDDQLWIIKFTVPKPTLKNTGEAHIKSYEGEMHIFKNSFGLSKIIVRGTASKRSLHSRSIIVGRNSKSYIKDVSFEVETSYTSIHDKFFLEKVAMTESFTDLSGKKQTTESSLTVSKQILEIVEMTGRDYYVKGL